jgi:osmotically inducible lipoprotein OsmB
MQRNLLILAALGTSLLLGGCGGNRFDRTVTGAAIGAASGAGAGLLLGPVGVASGALVGAGAGAGVGLATNERQINLGRPIYR